MQFISVPFARCGATQWFVAADIGIWATGLAMVAAGLVYTRRQKA